MVMVVGEEDTEVAERKTTERKKKEIIFSVFLLFISSAEFVLQSRRNFSSNYLLG
jgi:hypothetical protein